MGFQTLTRTELSKQKIYAASCSCRPLDDHDKQHIDSCTQQHTTLLLELTHCCHAGMRSKEGDMQQHTTLLLQLTHCCHAEMHSKEGDIQQHTTFLLQLIYCCHAGMRSKEGCILNLFIVLFHPKVTPNTV